jgi:hypothetical protein
VHVKRRDVLDHSPKVLDVKGHVTCYNISDIRKIVVAKI